MKAFQNIKFTLRFIALTAIAAAMALAAQPVQADPVLRGYWTFDSDTVESGVITESSGYLAGVHNGTLVNNSDGISFKPIAEEPGSHLSSGNYISFTNDSYAVIDHSGTLVQSDCQSTFDFGGGAFTISAWVKGLPSDIWRPYIAKNGESYGYQLRRLSDQVTPTFTYRLSDGEDDPGVNIPNVNSNLNDNAWHNLVAVYGGSYRDLYMDGRLVMHIVDSATTAGGEGDPLVFSARYVGGYQGFSNISLDDVAIYSGALTSHQALYLSNGGNPTQMISAMTPTENDHVYTNTSTETVGSLSNKSDKASSLFKSGSGELILSQHCSYTGFTYVTDGTLTLQATGETGTLPGGSVIYVDGANSVLQGHGDVLGYYSGTIGAVFLNNGGTLHNDDTGTHITVGAPIFMNNGTISAQGAGNNDVGNFILDNSIIVDSGTENVLDCPSVHIRNGGAVNVADGAVMTYKANVRDGSNPLTKYGKGTLILEGEYQPNDREINNLGGGTLILKKSVLNSRVQTHNGGHTIVDVGEDGIVQMPTDGYTYSLMIGNGSDGAFTLNSGNVIVRYPDLNYPYGSVQLGTNGAVHGSLTINGGNMQVDGRILLGANNDNAKGTLNMNNGLLSLGVEGRYISNYPVYTDPACGVLWFGQGTSIVNLNGGTIALFSICDSASGPREGSEFNFNGGTIQAVANNELFFRPLGNMKFNVKEGGAIIDTQSFNVVVSALLQAPESGVSGGLTKKGTGTLTLTQAPGFTGATTVEQGTLALAAGGTLYNLSGGSLNDDGTVAAAATLDASNQVLTLSNNDTSTFIGSITAQRIEKNGSGVLQIYAGDPNSPVTVQDGFVVNAGRLDFKGYMNGSLTIGGSDAAAVLSPGNSVGTMNVTGAVTIAENGKALFEFGSYESGLYDVLNVLGDNNGFTAGEKMIELLFLENDADAWAAPGKEYRLVSDNGFEPTDDLTSWLTSDFDGLFALEGRSTGLYLVSLASPEPGTGVPEPSTWALLLLGAAGLLYWRKRK